jgi:hypothetical protein
MSVINKGEFMELYISELALETTRRCQFECGHCMRGGAQNKDGDIKHVKELLQDVNLIEGINFTGGEPFLNVSFIEEVLGLVQKRKIAVRYFYIATNGIIFNKVTPYSIRCLRAILDWWCYCDDKEICSLEVSDTQWHRQQGSGKDALNNMLGALSFAQTRSTEMTYDNLIPVGRGANIASGRRSPFYNCEPEDPHCMVYLSVHGGVMWGCDFDYETTDEDAISIQEALSIIRQLQLEECEEYEVCEG